MSTLERKIYWTPAYDKRSSEPSKNYGVHGVNVVFQVKGEAGGLTFTIFTNWQLPHVQAEMNAKPLHDNPSLRYMFHTPMPAGCDGHWKTPSYKEQSPIQNCDVTGGDCYCDGTSLTDDLFTLLVTEGDEALWKKLEERYEAWRPK